MAEEQEKETKAKDSKPFDAMDPWRNMRDAYLEMWGKSMVEMVNSDAYAQATGAMLDTYLTMSAPFRAAVEKAMLQTLEQLAMPTRVDVISIAERMTNVEMRLDDLDAKLDQIQKLVSNSMAVHRAPAKAAARPTKEAGASKKSRRGARR